MVTGIDPKTDISDAESGNNWQEDSPTQWHWLTLDQEITEA